MKKLKLLHCAFLSAYFCGIVALATNASGQYEYALDISFVVILSVLTACCSSGRAESLFELAKQALFFVALCMVFGTIGLVVMSFSTPIGEFIALPALIVGVSPGGPDAPAVLSVPIWIVTSFGMTLLGFYVGVRVRAHI
jgi:hypothetical protein